MKTKTTVPKNKFILNRLFLFFAISAISLHAGTITLTEDASADADYRAASASIQTIDMINYKDNGGNHIVNYIGDVVSSSQHDFQAALKFTLPATSSVLSTAKLYIKVIDKSNAPTSVVKLADNNGWQQTSGGTSSFPTLTNAVTLLTGYSISSTGNLPLNLDATLLAAKMGSIISLVVSSGNATSGSNTYFNFVADDDAISNGGSAANNAYLALTFKPKVTNVFVPANGTYKAGDALNFVVSFDSLVNVTGTPKLSLTLNTGGTVQASYMSGSGTQNLTFRYTVASGDADADGVTVGSALTGGTIRSDNGDDAELTLYSVGATTGVKVDAVVPTISSVAPPAGGTYASGQNLDFTATFSKAVTVVTTGGTPYIAVTIGGVTKHASYVSGNGTTALVFRYTLASGDAGALATNTGITLNGGTLKDGAGNSATLTFTSPTTTGITVDAVAPTISGVTPPTSGTYASGQNLDFTATFSKAVTVVTTGGTPYIAVTIGGVTKHASYVSGSGTTALVFRYTLASGDAGALATNTGITLNGGTVKDGAGNDATLTFTSPTTTGITVDAVAPTISGVTPPTSGTYASGQNLDFTATFSKAVTVVTTGGTPYIAVTIGGVTKHASYVSGSGTTALVFRYTLASGDAGALVTSTGITLNGGTVKDGAGNDATLTFTSPTTTGITVDAVAPTISGVTPPTSGTYASGQNLDFAATFSKAVTVVTTGGTPYITLTIGSATKHASYVSGSGTTALVFRYTLASGDAGALATGTGITLNGGTVKDGAGNDATLTFTSPTTSGVTVDTRGSQTITFDPLASQTYGTAFVKLTATASSGLVISYASGNTAAVRISNDTAYLLAADTATITASQPGNASYLAATSASQKLTITKKGLSITGAVATNRAYDGTTAATVTGAVLSGVVNSDGVSLVLGTATFATKDTGTAKPVTVTGSVLSGMKAGNYSLTEVSGLTASIAAKPLAITGVMASSKVYDGTSTATLTGGALNGVVAGDTVVVVAGTGNFADKAVGLGKTVTATGYNLSGTSARNYTLSAQPTRLAASITAKPITVTADAKTKVYGSAEPALTWTDTGLVSGDVLTGALSRDTGSVEGTYAITQGTLSAGSNYSLTFVPANLIITAPATAIEGANPQHLPKVRDLGLSAVGMLPSRATGFGRAELGLSRASDEAVQSVSVLLPEAGTISVHIFDLLGTPVISWSQAVDASTLANLDATADGRHVTTLSWNLRAASGVAVPAGVYLWKIQVNTVSGQKLETVKKLGVK